MLWKFFKNYKNESTKLNVIGQNYCLILSTILKFHFVSFNIVKFCVILYKSYHVVSFGNEIFCYARLSQLPGQLSDTIYKLTEANQVSTLE